MWAQVWDGHLESQKNPDQLKRIIHVDRIGVHSKFVYIYAVLQVSMIWADCFFLLNVFSFEKSRRYDDNQQVTVSHFGEHKRLHLESSKQNYYIISLWVIIKAIFILSVSEKAFSSIWYDFWVFLFSLNPKQCVWSWQLTISSENYMCIYTLLNIKWHTIFLIRHMIYCKSLNNI